jgi:hypothetical protein
LARLSRRRAKASSELARIQSSPTPGSSEPASADLLLIPACIIPLRPVVFIDCGRRYRANCTLLPLAQIKGPLLPGNLILRDFRSLTTEAPILSSDRESLRCEQSTPLPDRFHQHV